jgi:ParB-like chromosome segregation protein Spo0J
MSKLEIRYVSLEEVRPYAGNARTHSKKQIRQIADSIERFGFVNPIIVSSDHEVIAGHGRVAAAKLLGILLRSAVGNDVCSQSDADQPLAAASRRG